MCCNTCNSDAESEISPLLPPALRGFAEEDEYSEDSESELASGIWERELLSGVKMTATTEKVTCSMLACSDDLTDGEIVANVVGMLVAVALIAAAVVFSKGKGDTHAAPKNNGNSGDTLDTTEVSTRDILSLQQRQGLIKALVHLFSCVI